jgi:hypothetical protein
MCNVNWLPLSTADQDCQKVYFLTKNPNLGKFGNGSYIFRPYKKYPTWDFGLKKPSGNPDVYTYVNTEGGFSFQAKCFKDQDRDSTYICTYLRKIVS